MARPSAYQSWLPLTATTGRELLTSGSKSAAAGGVSLLVKGEFLDAWGLQIVRYRVPIADLPPGLDGVRAVLLAAIQFI